MLTSGGEVNSSSPALPALAHQYVSKNVASFLAPL